MDCAPLAVSSSGQSSLLLLMYTDPCVNDSVGPDLLFSFFFSSVNKTLESSDVSQLSESQFLGWDSPLRCCNDVNK